MKKDGLSLSKLEKQIEGVELDPMKPVLPERLFTKNKRIELMPELFVNEMEKVKELLNRKPVGKYPLKLIGRRHLRSNNSWMHNLPVLEGGSKNCTMMIHPQDAAEYNISNEEEVEVFSKNGNISIAAEITSDIIPGTISIPHGWGHSGKGIQLEVAQRNQGVNVNELMDHDRLDPLSYNMAFNGQPVEIRKMLI